MKKSLISISLFIFLICSLAYSETTKSNPYNLDIIQTIAQYDSSLTISENNMLVDLERFIPSALLDIRYATNNNFTKQIIYTKPKAYLRRPAAEALREVQNELIRKNLCLKIYDAYRPYQATVRFFDVLPDTNFCANPRYGSRHNRGCAVDVSLVYFNNGKDVAMPTDFDDFTEKANPNYKDLPQDVIKHRQLLIDVMSKFGFTVYPTEWWHFDYSDWEKFKLMDLSFEELSK